MALTMSSSTRSVTRRFICLLPPCVCACVSARPTRIFLLQLARYQADHLPALYRDQPELYEAQLQMPLGREWNTQRVFDTITRPRVCPSPAQDNVDVSQTTPPLRS